MSEPKPFASLTSGLLARKGAAVPAMRRQAMLNGGGLSPFDTAHAPQHDHDDHDLGWNDMGEDTRASETSGPIGLTPMGASAIAATPITQNAVVADEAPVPAVVEQRRVLAEKVAAPVEVAPMAVADPVAMPAPVAAAMPARSKAAFTLRLDPERHLRLRLACAVGNRSAQQIVTQALDAFLDSQPQIEALADQLPRPGNTQL